ncbi:MAG: LytTR family transcriptional regulator DNA-binding domain-containing protein [Flavobacteriales bacterium]|nr:LytTR family transcriptional regulator DNA-binding domain-containing protein [Flavobacteriales bacterium]
MTNGKKYSVRGSLIEYMNKLSKVVFGTHRSYIANLDYMEELKQTKIIFNNAEISWVKIRRKS